MFGDETSVVIHNHSPQHWHRRGEGGSGDGDIMELSDEGRGDEIASRWGRSDASDMLPTDEDEEDQYDEGPGICDDSDADDFAPWSGSSQAEFWCSQPPYNDAPPPDIGGSSPYLISNMDCDSNELQQLSQSSYNVAHDEEEGGGSDDLLLSDGLLNFTLPEQPLVPIRHCDSSEDEELDSTVSLARRGSSPPSEDLGSDLGLCSDFAGA